MNAYAQHIVSRLKQLPRQGQGIPSDDDLKRRADAASTSTGGAVSDITRLKGVYLELDEAVQKFAKTTANTTMATGKAMKVHQDLAKRAQDLSKDVNVLAQRNHDLQKSFGLNVETAAGLGYEMDKLSFQFKTSRGQIEKNYAAIRKLSYGSDAMNESMQQMNQYFSVNRGLSDDATQNLLAFNASLTKGGTTEEMKQQVESQRQLYKYLEQTTGIMGAQKDIEEGISSAAAGTRLTFKKYPAQLGLAVMKLKQMGMELADLETVGDNLLNIESSVGEELNYQLLTGRRLVGEKGKNEGKSLTNLYREQYLRGKSADAADTLNQIIMQEGDILENNMLARKQMAKTLGIEEDKLNSIVERRKLLKQLEIDKGIKIDLNLTGKALEETLKKQGVAAEDISKIMTADDTRSPEQKTADILASIESKGILLRVGTKNEAIDKITDSQKESLKFIDEYSTTLLGTFRGLTNSMTELGTKQMELATRDKDAADGVIQTLLNLEKATGGLKAVGATYAQDLLNTIGSSISTYLVGTPIETMTVTSMNVASTTGTNDGVMINDGFVSFNPRDKFRKINDGMTLAGTNVGGLDRYASQMESRDRNFQQSMKTLFTALARDIKTAIETANLTVKTDNAFKPTPLNPVGRYGGRG